MVAGQSTLCLLVTTIGYNSPLFFFIGESDERARTRERFNEVFKKYTETEKKKKLKKKNAETQETIVVCILNLNQNLLT